MFGSPLTVSQQALQKRRPSEFTIAQLHEWIDACDTMEHWVKNPSARKAWTKAREEAQRELARRTAPKKPA